MQLHKYTGDPVVRYRKSRNQGTLQACFQIDAIREASDWMILMEFQSHWLRAPI